MDSVNSSNRLNRFLGVFQRGAKVVRKKVIPKAIKVASAATKIFPKVPSIPVPLMNGAKVLVEAVVPLGNDSAFPELPIVHVDGIFNEWSPERIDFIRTHCMKTFEECTGNGVTTIEDSDKVFVARSELVPDISVTQAQKFGFILPENISERMRCNPNLKIKPLMIRCFGVGSGSTLAQIQEGARNILSSPTGRLESANALVLSHIELVRRRFESNSNVLIVPFVTGFSLGGMFASAIAARNNITSMVFNGLGLGESACNFVGIKNWTRAQ
jgi:hypothetical protein